MTIARHRLIDVETTTFYHCIAHCARHNYLAGFDEALNKNVDYRKGWVKQRMTQMAQAFAIEICAFAIMSNHYHLVLHINKDMAASWSLSEILLRWTSIYHGDDLTKRYLAGESLDECEKKTLAKISVEYRERLTSISWFMRGINEYVAVRANRESGLDGKFWRARFKSQALTDENALLTCMAYVDLNPIRAGIAKVPEKSDYTSIQERIRQILRPEAASIPLMSFKSEQAAQKVIPYTAKDYMNLVDMTGRVVRPDKIGSIPRELPPILERLGVSSDEWLLQVRYFELRFKRVAGAIDSLRLAAKKLNQKWFQRARSPLANQD